MSKKIKLVDIDHKPICPFCEAELDQIGKISGGLREGSVTSICPHCRKILGIQSTS